MQVWATAGALGGGLGWATAGAVNITSKAVTTERITSSRHPDRSRPRGGAVEGPPLQRELFKGRSLHTALRALVGMTPLASLLIADAIDRSGLVVGDQQGAVGRLQDV